MRRTAKRLTDMANACARLASSALVEVSCCTSRSDSPESCVSTSTRSTDESSPTTSTSASAPATALVEVAAAAFTV